jgi:hypothetical protein
MNDASELLGGVQNVVKVKTRAADGKDSNEMPHGGMERTRPGHFPIAVPAASPDAASKNGLHEASVPGAEPSPPCG